MTEPNHPETAADSTSQRPAQPTPPPALVALTPSIVLGVGALLAVLIALVSDAHVGWLLVAVAAGGAAWWAQHRRVGWPAEVHHWLATRRLASPDVPVPANVPTPAHSSPVHGSLQPRDPLIPFRPLTVGELFTGTGKVIGRYWYILLGIPVGILVGVVVIAMLVTELVLSAAVSSTTFDPADPLLGFGGFLTAAAVLVLVIFAVGFFFDALLLGLSVLTTDHAVKGAPIRMRAVVAEARSRFFAICRLTAIFYLIGFAPTAILIAVVMASPSTAMTVLPILVPLLGIGSFIVGILFSLAPIVLITERLGALASFQRAFQLAKPAFARLLGLHLLWALGVIVIAAITGSTGFSLVLYSALLGVIVALYRVFQMLIYTDLRMRQENYGPQLDHEWTALQSDMTTWTHDVPSEPVTPAPRDQPSTPPTPQPVTESPVGPDTGEERGRPFDPTQVNSTQVILGSPSMTRPPIVPEQRPTPREPVTPPIPDPDPNHRSAGATRWVTSMPSPVTTAHTDSLRGGATTAAQPNRWPAAVVILSLLGAGLVVALTVGGFWLFSHRSAPSSVAVATPTVTETITPATDTTAALEPPPGPPAGATPCGSGVAAGTSVTSCQFALAVREAYLAQGPLGHSEARTIIAFSPITATSYRMTCLPDGTMVTCRGGNDAVVHLY